MNTNIAYGLSIITLISCASICLSVATMIVTYFSIRKVNLWVLWSIIIAIISTLIKDIILHTELDIQYPHLFVAGIAFTILMIYMCFRKNKRGNQDEKEE